MDTVILSCYYNSKKTNKGVVFMNYGYCRCSTNESKQDVNRQVREVVKLGADKDKIYTEYESGTKRNRIELNRVLDALAEGDTFITTEASRVSRSMKDLLEILDILKNKKVKVILGTFTLDFSKGEVDPMVMGMVQMMGVFSEMERNITVSRIKSGLANAKAKGVELGRRKTTVDNIPASFKKYYQQYKDGQINVTELGKLAGLKSRTTVYKYIKMLEGQ